MTVSRTAGYGNTCACLRGSVLEHAMINEVSANAGYNKVLKKIFVTPDMESQLLLTQSAWESLHLSPMCHTWGLLICWNCQLHLLKYISKQEVKDACTSLCVATRLSP